MIRNKLVVPGCNWEVLPKDKAVELYSDVARDYELYSVNPITYVEFLLETAEDLCDLEHSDNLLCKYYK